MTGHSINREILAKRTLDLRNIRFKIESLKLKAKNADLDYRSEYQHHLDQIESNYDLAKEKLTEFATREQKDAAEIQQNYNHAWQQLNQAIEKIDDFLS